MNRSRYKERALPLPQPAGARKFDLGFLLLLSLLTVFLSLAATRQAFADPWSQGTGGPANSRFVLHPREGQYPMQRDRDLYECRMWAVEETGYDPALPPFPAQRQARVEPMPPFGYDTAVFGFTGAILGAVLGGYHHSPQAALIGGAIGAMVGLASDSSRAEAAGRIQAENEWRARERESRIEEREEYRRALEACLEDRGYGVN